MIRNRKAVWNFSVPVLGTECLFVPRVFMMNEHTMTSKTAECVDVEVALKDGLFLKTGQCVVMEIKDGFLNIRILDVAQ